MKTARRALVIVLAVILALALCAVALTACGNEGEVNPGGGGTIGGDTNKPVIDEGDICNGIEILTMPAKLEYKTGEKFTPIGLTFNATYENGYVEEDLTAGDLDGWTPRDAFTTWGEVEVTLIFEGYEEVITVDVEPKTLENMYIKTEPSVLSYSVGSKIDFGGMDVMAKYAEDEEEVNETNYTVTDAKGKKYVSGETILDTPGTIELTVTITAGDIKMTDTFTIEVINGFSVQVEDTVKDGQTPTDKSYTVLSGGNVNSNLPCTGSEGNTAMYLGDIYSGDYMEFHIYSATEVKGAQLVLVAASTLINNDGQKMDDMVLSDIFDMSVGGKPYEYDGDVILPGNPFPEAGSNANKWAMWENVTLGTVDLNAGYTVVRLTCTETPKDCNGDYRAGNFDRLDIVFPEVIENPCTNIEITTNPKTAYTEGETFDPTGIEFTATYEDESTAVGLSVNDITWTPSRALTTEDTYVTITHKGFENPIPVTVSERKLSAVEIVSEPNRNVFAKGEKIDLTGLTVKATYEGGYFENITDYTVTGTNEKSYVDGVTVLDTTGELTLTVTAESGGVKKTDTFTINVFDGITVQAEANGEHGETDSYTVLEPVSDGIKIKTNESHSEGNACVENVKVGDKLTFNVYADVAGDYELVVTTCSTLRKKNGDKITTTLKVNFGEVFKVTVGGEQLTLTDVVIPEKDLPSGGSIWFNWQEISLGTVTLEEGYNAIVFECIAQQKDPADGSMRAPNFDAIDLLYNAEA